jgi:excisionase family DNA binding protein
MADECEERAKEAETLAALPRVTKCMPAIPEAEEKLEPLTISIKDAGRVLGLGRSTIYRLMGEGHLHAVEIGNRTLIKTASIRELADAGPRRSYQL